MTRRPMITAKRLLIAAIVVAVFFWIVLPLVEFLARAL